MALTLSERRAQREGHLSSFIRPIVACPEIGWRPRYVDIRKVINIGPHDVDGIHKNHEVQMCITTACPWSIRRLRPRWNIFCPKWPLTCKLYAVYYVVPTMCIWTWAAIAYTSPMNLSFQKRYSDKTSHKGHFEILLPFLNFSSPWNKYISNKNAHGIFSHAFSHVMEVTNI